MLLRKLKILPIRSKSNAQALEDAVRSLGINRISGLLFSDTAKFLVATDAILNFLYTKLFCGTYVAPLFHNCATYVKSHFKDVDQLIAEVKSATVKKQIQTNQIRCYWLPATACCYKMEKLVTC